MGRRRQVDRRTLKVRSEPPGRIDNPVGLRETFYYAITRH